MDREKRNCARRMKRAMKEATNGLLRPEQTEIIVPLLMAMFESERRAGVAKALPMRWTDSSTCVTRVTKRQGTPSAPHANSCGGRKSKQLVRGAADAHGRFRTTRRRQAGCVHE